MRGLWIYLHPCLCGKWGSKGETFTQVLKNSQAQNDWNLGMEGSSSRWF